LLIQSQINGDWRTFANLIDRTLGKKMFAYLGRASANLEDFQAFVRDLEAGKTAADFSAELLQKRQRQVLAGSQTAS
ncbi:hypothetical protein IJI99_01640, partial [bacterium]|nr:hypothetical protein [bacterium]